MARPQSIQKIEDIERGHPDQWLMIEVLRHNRRYEATHGRLLVTSKHRDTLYSKVKNYSGSSTLYSSYTGKSTQSDYCLCFTERD